MRLLRKRDNSVSYYSVAVYPTLFDDYLLMHQCGSQCTQKSTKTYFSTKKEALIGSLEVIADRQKRGFKILRSSQRE